MKILLPRPPESVESNFGVNVFDLCSSWLIGRSLIEDGYHGISWMRDDSAEYTSNITRHESDHELLALAVFRFWLGEDFTIEHRHDFLEGDELDNGVWNLSAPEWGNTFVESIESFSRVDNVKSFDSRLWEGSCI